MKCVQIEEELKNLLSTFTNITNWTTSTCWTWIAYKQETIIAVHASCFSNIYLGYQENQLDLENLSGLKDLLLLVIQHCLETERAI